MTVVAISPRSGRRLNARGRARRAQRAAARRQRLLLVAGGALVIVTATPLSIAAYMNMDSDFPGISAAKSFLAMMADRSPGDRTKAELTKTQRRAAPPTQRALGKITKPEPPKEFTEAIAPPIPKIDEIGTALAPPVDIGPLLLTPQPPGGGGIIIPPSAPPGGGGGPNPPSTPPGGGGGPNPPPDDGTPPPCEDCTPTPVINPPAVPEPGTWATMLMGFGLVGWLMRRRRRTMAGAAPSAS
jgi:hypothetical protein